MIWNKEKECMSRDELLNLQGKKLVAQVKYVYQNIAYYKEKMQVIGLEPEDIRGIEDLDKLPYTTKKDIYNENSANLPIGIEQFLDSHEGTEQIENCTTNDIKIRAECVARFLFMAGLNKDDIIQMTYNGDMAAGRQGVKYGIEKIGVKVCENHMSCNTKKIVSMMAECGVTSIMCTPTYLMRIAQTIKESEDIRTFCLKSSICSGEPFSEISRRYMEDILRGKVYDTYSLNGVSGFGVAGECEYQNGMHIQEDFFLAEVYRETGTKVSSDMEQGELVLTTLEEGGYPLIRYRTGDIISLNHEKCVCGRTTTRMMRIENRDNDLFMIRGTKVLRFQIEQALAGLSDMETGYTVRIDRENNLDVVDVIIESYRHSKIAQMQSEETMKIKVKKAMKNVIGMIPRVSIADKEIANRFEGGKVTVLDQRSFA